MELPWHSTQSQTTQPEKNPELPTKRVPIKGKYLFIQLKFLLLCVLYVLFFKFGINNYKYLNYICVFVNNAYCYYCNLFFINVRFLIFTIFLVQVI